MKKNKILVIEDDNDVRESLVDVLLAYGHDVHEACHGQDAFDKLETSPVPSLIILDAMMPVMDGKTFFEKFRKIEKYNSVPVVLFSAISERVEFEGISDTLQKPANIEDILALVSKHLKT